MRGPTFARVFDTPGLAYSERFKHTIGPEATWRYRTRVDDLDAIPRSRLGSEDSLAGTEEIRYGLVQRLYAKRRGTGGRSQPYELFSWDLTQVYYVRIAQAGAASDPNFSSPILGPAGLPEHLAPISSRMRLHPSPDHSLDYDLEYDVNFRQLLSMSVSARVSRPRLFLDAGWSCSFTPEADPAKRSPMRDDLQGRLAIELVPGTLFVEGSAAYGMVEDTLHQLQVRVRYSAQCCGLVLEHVRSNVAGVADPRWGIRVELANVGSVGGFFALPDLFGGRRPGVSARSSGTP
jgi:hypothetical protein